MTKTPLTILSTSEVREGASCPFCRDDRIVTVKVSTPILGVGAYIECWHCSARGRVSFELTEEESIIDAEESWNDADRSPTFPRLLGNIWHEIYWWFKGITFRFRNQDGGWDDEPLPYEEYPEIVEALDRAGLDPKKDN